MRLTLPNGDPGDQGAWRWRKTFCSKDGKVTKVDPDKIKLALEDAARRAVRICEQEKDGTVRGTGGTGEREWYTPSKYIERVRAVFDGAIDLDPASKPKAQEIIRAEKFYTEEDNGLQYYWYGNVWLNPPYEEPLIAEFVSKLRQERQAGRVTAAILLTHNYTDTAWFQDEILSFADAICFTRGRIKFYNPDGELAKPTQGQAFSYFGPDVRRFKDVFCPIGRCWPRDDGGA